MAGQDIQTIKIKKFIWGSLCLAVSFFLFDRLLFLALRFGATQYYASLKVQEFPWRKPAGAGIGQILILGTSRSNFGFDDDVLSAVLNKKVYKEARAGCYPQYHYYFYQKYKKIFRPPSLVIYGLDYFIFENDSSDLNLVRLEETVFWERMNPRRAVNPASPWLSRVSWLYRLKPKTDEWLADLWNSLGKPDEREESAAKDSSPRHGLPRLRRGRQRGMPREVIVEKPLSWDKRFYNPFPGKEGLFLDRLLGDLDGDGVPVFLVFLPDYIGSNETNFEQEKYKKDISRLATRHHKVHIIDFNTPEKFDLNDFDLYWNGGWGVTNCHLDDKGARLFTGQLAREIKKILKAGQTENKPSNR
jgi:hypothetical protein